MSQLPDVKSNEELKYVPNCGLNKELREKHKLSCWYPVGVKEKLYLCGSRDFVAEGLFLAGLLKQYIMQKKVVLIHHLWIFQQWKLNLAFLLGFYWIPLLRLQVHVAGPNLSSFWEDSILMLLIPLLNDRFSFAKW